MGLDRQLLERLNTLKHSKTLVLGIGNALKGDDGAGPLVCQKLTQAGVPVEVIDAGTVPENYIEQIIRRSPENLIIIDAVDFGGNPGEVRLFETEQVVSVVSSTHSLSPRLFLDLIGRRIPVNSCLIGIQASQTRLNSPISPDVTKSVETLSYAIARVFARKTTPTRRPTNDRE